MSKRSKTPTFIAEFQLRTTPADECALRIRLDAARQIYNAALGEALRRLKLMRESKAWKAARGMPKGKERNEAFKELRQRFGFSFYDLKPFTAACRNNCWIGDHLGSQEMQALTNRAIKTVEQYAYGKRGKPRFKRFGEFNSVENQCDTSGLRFTGEGISWRPNRDGKLLEIPIHAPDDYQTEALKGRVKHARVLRREIRGRARWYVQIMLQGLPPQRRLHGAGVVGIDLGPSAIALVSDGEASLEQFCPTVEQPWREMRTIERSMDRSKRATNPDAFDEKGRYKRGARIAVRSRRYQQLATKRRERERKLAAERKRSHGELANRVLGQGTDVRLEKLSYRAFQKCFGRSTKVRAAGTFVSILQNKIKAADGQLIEINTYKTKLSQFDHTTGEYVKKSLSQRTHHFGDGITPPVQRDIYSAFLARCCSTPETLDVPAVAKSWAALGSTLRQATPGETQSAKGRGFAIPPAFKSRGADRLLEMSKRRIEAGEAVGKPRAPESAAITGVKSSRGGDPPREHTHGNTQPSLEFG